MTKQYTLYIIQIMFCLFKHKAIFLVSAFQTFFTFSFLSAALYFLVTCGFFFYAESSTQLFFFFHVPSIFVESRIQHNGSPLCIPCNGKQRALQFLTSSFVREIMCNAGIKLMLLQQQINEKRYYRKTSGGAFCRRSLLHKAGDVNPNEFSRYHHL